MNQFSDTDLKYVVETVADKSQDPDKLRQAAKEKEELLDSLLDDPRLGERLLNDKEVFVRVSPALLFAILLRCVRRELEKTLYVYELEGRGRRIPVFQAPQVVELLLQPVTRDYLVDMLCSFMKIQSGMIYWQEGGQWKHRRFSDMDMDDMIQLCRLVDSEYWPALHKRIADIALFLSGVYPEQSALFAARPKRTLTPGRTLHDYEQEGKQFYELAARGLDHSWLGPACGILAEKFTLARHALNTLSDRYLKPIQDQLI